MGSPNDDMDLALGSCIHAESAMSNDLIIEAILSFLPAVQDLKRIRQLNPTCYSLSTKKMIPICQVGTGPIEPYFKSLLEMDLPPETRTKLCRNYSKRILALVNLTFLNNKLPDFLINKDLEWIQPFSGVKVTRMWVISSDEFVSFFREFGKTIKVLYLEDTFKGTVSDVARLLTEFAPNVEVLILDPNIELEPTSARNWLAPKRLPNLRVIKIDGIRTVRRSGGTLEAIPRLCYGIVAAAPNLEYIEGVPTDLLNVARLARMRMSLGGIIQYTANLDLPNLYRHQLEYLASLAPKLQRLTFKSPPLLNPLGLNLLPSALWCELHNSILESSKDSLENLRIDGDDMQVPEGVRLPALKNVRSLDLLDLLRFGQNFKPGSVSALTFPNLVEIVVDQNCAQQTDNFTENLLPEDYANNNSRVLPIESVRRLKLRNKGVSIRFSLNFLKVKFPRVTHVSVEFKLITDRAIKRPCDLWSLPESVESLELDGVNLERFSYYGLDEWWTGIPRRVCSISQKLQWDSLDFDMLRRYPSIQNLTNLKHLKIICSLKDTLPRHQIGRTLPEGPYASNLSRWLVFGRMPELKFSIVYPCDSAASMVTQDVKGLRHISDIAQLLYTDAPS